MPVHSFCVLEPERVGQFQIRAPLLSVHEQRRAGALVRWCIEAANSSGEEFGEHRLIAAVESNVHAEASEIRDRILRAVRQFTGSDVLPDDQTLLAIRYTGAAAGVLETKAP